MASPRLEDFCCSNRDSSTEFIINFQSMLFSGICIGSSVISLVLSILQILPKRRGYRRYNQYSLSKPASSSRIIFMISVCDILGCADVLQRNVRGFFSVCYAVNLGIIFRSSVWIGMPTLISRISVPENTDIWPKVFCVGSAIWIQLFYSASFWWTFCYAVDVYLVVKRSAGISTIVLYHMITWGLAVMLCIEGVAMLYYPSVSSCEDRLLHAVPHYITTYAPLLLVLLVNPVLFSRTVAAVTSLLKGGQGIYTENERRLGGEIQTRFFKIMLVFCICWLPNIVNDSLLFYLEMQTDMTASSLKNIRNATQITWFIMGILNPMHGFLNTLAFHGWTGFNAHFRFWPCRGTPWDSASTSGLAGDTYNPVPVLYQSHVQETKKSIASNGRRLSESINFLSEGSESSTIEIHISSEL